MGLAALLGGLAFWIVKSDTFVVARVESGSYRFTAETDLQDALGLLLGRNIWTLSRGDAAEQLAHLPWVRDLELRRRLPGTLQVDFREWDPLLQLPPPDDDGGRPLVLRGDGRLVPFPDHLPLPGLPVLVGVTPVRAEDGTAWVLPAEHLPVVLDLVAAMEAAGIETIDPVDFVVARSEGYAIVLQNRQGTLLVGRDNFADRLERYVVARDRLKPGLEVDLRFKNRITVRPVDG